MGGRPLSSSDVSNYYTVNHHIGRAADAREIFKQNRMNPAFDPSRIKLPREACDSAESPNSRGIILAEDVTGSMDRYLLDLIKNQFPKLIQEIQKCASYNPHIMFMGIGDVMAGDEAPLQVSQFEADTRIIDQLQQIWLEGCGGGNGSESYALAWYFAAMHTRMDCFEKRRQKGFLFTFGNDGPTPRITREEIKTVFGDNSDLENSSISGEECLMMAKEKFNCYHITLGGFIYDNPNRVWKRLMGNRAIGLTAPEYVSELIITILRMYEGDTKTEALNKIPNGRVASIIEEALIDHEEVIEKSEVSDSDADITVF